MSNRDQQLESTLFHSLALDASLTFVSFHFVFEMCVCVCDSGGFAWAGV